MPFCFYQQHLIELCTADKRIQKPSATSYFISYCKMQHSYSFSPSLIKTSEAEEIQKAVRVNESQHVCVVAGGGGGGTQRGGLRNFQKWNKSARRQCFLPFDSKGIPVRTYPLHRRPPRRKNPRGCKFSNLQITCRKQSTACF